MKKLESWKLNIPCFYAIGLTHYNNANDEAALVIAWSRNWLCTKKFRNFKNAIDNDLPADREYANDVQKIAGSSISRIVTGTLESVILTESGQLMYFEKRRIQRKVDYIHNIRCISAYNRGFLILLLTKEGNIVIMLHPDSFPCRPELLQSFDVSFESDFCQTTWEDSRFNIVSLQANHEKPAFFNSLRKCPGEQYSADSSFIFFSINNTFLTLVVDEDGDDYRYHQIQTHSSNIRGIHASKDLNAIYLLLESGVVDVIYSCAILEAVKSTSLFFMYNVGPYDINDDIFVYSDGFRVVIGEIHYFSETNSFGNQFKVIYLPGIVALTIVVVNKQIICLSENRIFYKFTYSGDNFGVKQAAANEFMPVQEFLAQAERETIDISELISYYDQIKSETIYENKKLEAIALKYNYENSKSVFRIPLQAKLAVHRTIPELPPTAVYPKTMHLNPNDYFLHVQIQPHRFGEVFTSNIWSLTIQYESQCRILSKVIRLFNENFKEPLDVLIILKIQKEIVHPKVTINLSTSVTIGHDRLCVSFPVQANDIDFTDSIKISNKVSSCQIMSSNHCKGSLQSRKYSQLQKLECHLHLPKPITISELVQAIDPKSINTSNPCYLHLLSDCLELNADTSSNQLNLQTGDAAIMFYVKKMLIEHLRTTFHLADEHISLEVVQKYEIALMRIEDCLSGRSTVNKVNDIFNCINELRNLNFNER